MLGLKLRHALPILKGINLNGEPELEPVDSLYAKRAYPAFTGAWIPRSVGMPLDGSNDHQYSQSLM